MEPQKAPYPPQVIKIIAGIIASKDAYAPNYLKGPELVGLFQTLGFPDSYTFVEGRGIQTLDFGEGLSRLTYTTKRLEAINKSLQMPDAIRNFIENVQEPQEAINSIQEVLRRFNLPSGLQIEEKEICEKHENNSSDENSDEINHAEDDPELDLIKIKENTCKKSDGAKNNARKHEMEKSILGDIPSNRPVVFISYSWDSKEHQDWVAKLSEDLTNAGIYVLFDQYLEDGTTLPAFMDLGIERADKVIIIGTEAYKQKSYYADTGAAFEGCIIRTQIFQNLGTKKFIICLRHGTFKDSFPLILSGNKGHDFTNDANYITELDELCREIWHKPKRQRPTLGSIPDYVK